jgi:hypothetical protein
MTDDTRNLAAVEVAPSGIAYVYVGEGRNRMCLTRDPCQLGWLWSATVQWSGEISTGSFFGHWHQMMAYALERQALTPAEYKAAYEMREAE